MRTKLSCPVTRAGPLASKLQREIVLLLAWSPAILLQLAHPLVARGVADHSTFRTERYGWRHRLRRTVDAMLRLSFGTERDAQVALERINAIHDRVHGHLPEAAGIFPTGTPYSAHDPALLMWVHATLVHMNLRVYELFVDRVAPEDRDRYCAEEATAIEGGLGIPVGWLPRSATELDRYLDGMLARGEIAVTDTTRTLARAILHPHVPRLGAPATTVLRFITIGLLPPAIRAGYGFPWSARRDTALRGLAWQVRALLRLTPPVLRHWPAARAAARRSECPMAALRSPRA
ncbi:MAG: oxygenase MpaB family protein [Gammaproteobacteria bacterium]